MFKKFLAALTTALVAMALAVGAASPAMAYTADSPPTGEAGNHADNWEWATGEVCEKDDSSRPTSSYTVPAPSADRVYTKIILKAGSVNGDPNTVFYTPQTGEVLTTKDLKDISHIISCTIPVKVVDNVVDCSVVKLVEGRALNNSDHINMDIVQGNKKFQINIDIDDVQLQDGITSPSGLLVRVKIDGDQVLVRAVTEGEKKSGLISINYGTYLSGTWTVEWVQFSDTGRYFNQERAEAKFIKCGTELPDAAASVTLNPPSCNADGSLVLHTPTWADWVAKTVPAVGPYTVIAKAQTGHTFPADTTVGVTISDGGKTKTFEGTILPKDGDAADCIDKDASATIQYVQPTCFAPGAIDVAKSTLVNATWQGALPTAPGDHTVVAEAAAGHAFSDGALTKSFPVTILPKKTTGCDLPSLGLLTPTATVNPPTCSSGATYTLGGLEGAQFNWTVNGAAKTVPNGTYPAPANGGDVVLIADPVGDTDGLQDWTNPTTLSFDDLPPATCDLTTLALTGTGVSVQLTLAGVLIALAGLGFTAAARRMREAA